MIFFLGVEVFKCKESVVFLQRKYVLDLLKGWVKTCKHILTNPRIHMYGDGSEEADDAGHLLKNFYMW